MKNNNLLKLCLTIYALVLSQGYSAQSAIDTTTKKPLTETTTNDTQDQKTSGVSISPSMIRFNAKAGTTQVKTIKVNNQTNKSMSFQILLQDFGLSSDGKTESAKKPDDKYSLSKYLNISPSFIELKPYESKVITITANIPNNEFGYIAMWTNLVIDQVTERGKMEVPNATPKTIALGITAGMGFAIQVSQNPPNVIINNVEITKMNFQNHDVKNKADAINLKVKNQGDGIGYCLYYLELTNLATGKLRKFKVNQFGVLPGYEKEISFNLPAELPKGKYSGLAVIDFGDSGQLQTAELEFTIQ